VLELAPEWAEAHVHLAVCRMLRGDYEEGWKEFAWRTRILDRMDSADYPFGIPRLKGSHLPYIEPLAMWTALLGDLILQTPVPTMATPTTGDTAGSRPSTDVSVSMSRP